MPAIGAPTPTRPPPNPPPTLSSPGTIANHVESLGATNPVDRVRQAMREVIPLCLEGTDFTGLHLFHDLDGFLFYPSERRAYMEMQVRERERQTDRQTDRDREREVSL